jgi:hypothetical protein
MTNDGTAHKDVQGSSKKFLGLRLQQATQKSHCSFDTYKKVHLSQ